MSPKVENKYGNKEQQEKSVGRQKGQAVLEYLLTLPLFLSILFLFISTTYLLWSQFWIRYQQYEYLICRHAQKPNITCREYFKTQTQDILPFLHIGNPIDGNSLTFSKNIRSVQTKVESSWGISWTSLMQMPEPRAKRPLR